jgi:hypothetical protein
MRKQPLILPKAPKGGDIDAMLEFVHQQQRKTSQAEEMAKSLESVASQSKERQKYAAQTKVFMAEMRKLASAVERTKQEVENSLIDLSGILPELPEILRLDAKAQERRSSVYAKCSEFHNGMINLLPRKRTAQIRQLFDSVFQKMQAHLPTMAFTERYDELAEHVQRTKIGVSPHRVDVDYAGVPLDWKSAMEDEIAVFAAVEEEMSQDFKAWESANGFDPSVKYGGWEPLQHQRFLLCGDQNLRVEFPNEPLEELNRHKRWVIRTQFMKKKKESLRLELQKRLKSMHESAIRDARQREDREACEMAAEERRRSLAMEKEELSAHLAKERKEKEERDRIKKAASEEERTRKLEADLQRKAREDKKSEAVKRRISAEKEKKEQIRSENLEKRRLAEERYKALRMVRMKDAKKVVEARKRLGEEKERRKLESEAEAAGISAEKDRRLAALAQRVRDEFGLDDVESDPTRLTKIVEMRRAMGPEEKPMWVATSYASSVIEADPRIRVEMALREAGLMDSPYARQMMLRIGDLRPNPEMHHSTLRLV